MAYVVVPLKQTFRFYRNPPVTKFDIEIKTQIRTPARNKALLVVIAYIQTIGKVLPSKLQRTTSFSILCCKTHYFVSKTRHDKRPFHFRNMVQYVYSVSTATLRIK